MLVAKSAQAVPQFTSPVGHSQTPLVQEAPVGHSFRQAPQWRTSEVRSTQTPLQTTWPVGQSVQAPEMQLWPTVQEVLQAPQNSGSEERSAQRAPVQLTMPVGQTQAVVPAVVLQSAPMAHSLLH